MFQQSTTPTNNVNNHIPAKTTQNGTVAIVDWSRIPSGNHIVLELITKGYKLRVRMRAASSRRRKNFGNVPLTAKDFRQRSSMNEMKNILRVQWMLFSEYRNQFSVKL